VRERDGAYYVGGESGKVKKTGIKCKKNEVLHHNKITYNITHHITSHHITLRYISLRHSAIQVKGVMTSYVCGVEWRGGTVTFKSATTKYSGAPQNIVRSSQESLSKSMAATDPDWG
jgi:hypothetical protein